MTDTTHDGDRRSEQRAWTDPGRIAWRREDTSIVHGGWVTNTSRSGLAFLTATRDIPHLGDAIEVTLDENTRRPRTAAARVVRSEPHDAYFSIVACRRETDLVDNGH